MSVKKDIIEVFTVLQAIRAALADVESLEGDWDRLEAAGGFAQFFTAPDFDLEVLEVTSSGIWFECCRENGIVWSLLGVSPNFSLHPTLIWKSWSYQSRYCMYSGVVGRQGSFIGCWGFRPVFHRTLL